ncbi:MAG: dTDP-glucose 4,6-dehydratase [Bacteriovoracaceae bacterium]|nr:dTDP-glucose 4,6-dehydratase [Bacteriovoracaceae bacterium]
MKKKILLTGCAGFIGSNFVKTIACRSDVKSLYDFDIVDALTYAGRLENIQPDLDKNPHLAFYKIDIRDDKKINELFLERNYSGVIHFAAESHVDNSIKNPNIFVETNVLGTLNLLNASVKLFKDNKDFKFLHVSTDEVYGTLHEEEPAFTEEHKIQPNSPYSASKASSDLLVRAYYETFKLPTLITRCSNNYGPYQFPEKLIPLMISKAQKNEKLPVYGDGRNIRDWIYVDDHNEGVWVVFSKGKTGEVYNLGGNSEMRNIDVVKTILRELGKSEELISYVTDRPGHDWRYAMDFSKAKKELGWEPKIDFRTGIKKTVEWYL